MMNASFLARLTCEWNKSASEQFKSIAFTWEFKAQQGKWISLARNTQCQLTCLCISLFIKTDLGHPPKWPPLGHQLGPLSCQHMFLSVVSQKLDSRVMGPNKSPPKDREAGAEIYCPYLRLFFNPPSSANFPLITCLNSFPVRERGCLHKCLLWNGEIITEHPPHPRPFMNLAEMPFKSRSVREEQRSVGSSFQFSHCPLC